MMLVRLIFNNCLSLVQKNLCQKPSFLNWLTHNMTRDCSLNFPKNTSSEHVMYRFPLCTNIVLNVKTKTKKQFCTLYVVNLYFSWNTMNNLLSYCGLTDSRMRASEKDLPVCRSQIFLITNLFVPFNSNNLIFFSSRIIHHVF